MRSVEYWGHALTCEEQANDTKGTTMETVLFIIVLSALVAGRIYLGQFALKAYDQLPVDVKNRLNRRMLTLA